MTKAGEWHNRHIFIERPPTWQNTLSGTMTLSKQNGKGIVNVKKANLWHFFRSLVVTSCSCICSIRSYQLVCLLKIVNSSHRYLQNGWMWNTIINNQNTLNNGICIILSSPRLTISTKLCLLVTVYLGCYLLCLWSLSSKVENAIDFENAQLNRMWQLGLTSVIRVNVFRETWKYGWNPHLSINELCWWCFQCKSNRDLTQKLINTMKKTARHCCTTFFDLSFCIDVGFIFALLEF